MLLQQQQTVPVAAACKERGRGRLQAQVPAQHTLYGFLCTSPQGQWTKRYNQTYQLTPPLADELPVH